MPKKLRVVVKDHKKIIQDLEDELVRKQGIIDELKKENKLLLKTAIKQSMDKVYKKSK